MNTNEQRGRTRAAAVPVSVSMPASLHERVQAIVIDRHYGSVSEYMRELIRADLDGNAARPTNVKEERQDEAQG